VPFSRTEPNVPAYDEESNSPFDVTQESSITVTLDSPSDRVLIRSDPSKRGFSKLLVNGVRTSTYATLELDGTLSQNNPEMDVGIPIERGPIRLVRGDSAVRMSVEAFGTSSTSAVAGGAFDASGAITQFTLRSFDGGNRDARFRVYSLDI